MAKRPEDRIGSMDKVIQSLQAIQAGAKSRVLTARNTSTGHADETIDFEGGELEVDLANLPLSEQEDTTANSTVMQPTLVNGPYVRPGAGAAKPKSKLPWIVGGSLAGVLAIGMLVILGFAVWKLANRPADTVIIREQVAGSGDKVDQKPTLPPLPQPFSDRAAAEWALALGGQIPHQPGQSSLLQSSVGLRWLGLPTYHWL